MEGVSGRSFRDETEGLRVLDTRTVWVSVPPKLSEVRPSGYPILIGGGSSPPPHGSFTHELVGFHENKRSVGCHQTLSVYLPP